ncbi:unnamed protein product [Cylindrotheca closterium]|uniref:Uncharacterized protein n=1 Tax=Cylindrotheca closterium TaxID=2856 RepID=A0AAD2FF51_9STRA|nr:unnamed protein product [Cylindrotheca closterium]
MSDHSTRSSLSVDMATANKATAASIDNMNHSIDPETCPQIQRLEFADYLDVQTRLMLVPRIEEEGIGAVISTFVPSVSSQSANEDDNDKNRSEGSNENRDDSETSSDLTGLVLIRMESSPISTQQNDDWTDMDFTSILANIRQTTSFPIVLVFTPGPCDDGAVGTIEVQQGQNNEPAEVNSDHKNAGDHEEQNPQQHQQKDSINSLLSWGQRMRAQASVAANTAATAVATAAKERIQNTTQQTTHHPSRDEPKPCDVFYQTSIGVLIPANTLKEPKISTTSLLLVRASATKALSTKKGHQFQWYRSSKKAVVSVPDDLNSVTSTVSGKNDGCGDVEWIPLEGATSSAFQPNATLVGRRLRCHVTLEGDGNSSVDSDDSSDDDDDLNSIGSTADIAIDLEHPIVADPSIFNGARQALSRGAKFGGISGRGNAQSHRFSIDISIGVGKLHHKQVAMSAVTIHTVSGDETIKLTDEPIKQVTATADASNSNDLDLLFPVVPEEGSMLEAVLTDGKLLLKASNRITRESLLMALGIANYQGRPGKLGCKTLLFDDDVQSQQPRSFMDDDSLSSTDCTTPRNGSQLLSPDKSIASSLPLQSPAATITESVSGESPEKEMVSSLTNELEMLRAKLARKDKVVSELQRQVAKSEDVYQQMKTSLVSCQDELRQSRSACQNMQHAVQSAETKIESFESIMSETKSAHLENVKSLEGHMSKQSEKIAELEKNNKSLQNEKAVLSAAVEARESKLLRMGELRSSLSEMSEQVAKYHALQSELDQSNNRCVNFEKSLKEAKENEIKSQADMQSALEKIDKLTICVKQEEEKFASLKKEMEPLQKKNQQLKAERNSFKQKNDSLTKEIARICRNGRSVNEIDKMLSDHESLLEEIDLLRKQKKKALEDAHQYRMAYEQAKAAQERSGLDTQTTSILERNVELERLIAEMTEYVNAKEMQLETMKQVNEHLQQEIHSLAQANFNRNEV